MKNKRSKKIEDFKDFFNDCENIFNKVKQNNIRTTFFKNAYNLIISPGSRAGGTEKRIVEICWGARLYEFEPVSETKWESKTETGAYLLFYRHDKGDVTIFLYPAKTDFQEPIENNIVLHKLINPKKLKQNKFILSLWSDFIAYMECTSLDGEPTCCQRLRVFYLRTFKNLIINNKYNLTRFVKLFNYIVKWTFTIGCSGGIIYLFTQPLNTETKTLLKKVNQNIETVSKHLEEISKDKSNSKTLLYLTDSILFQPKYILTNPEKKQTSPFIIEYTNR